MPTKELTDPLDSIIGDYVRAKILRVFALNKEDIYTPKEFAKALKRKEDVVRYVIKWLEKDNIIKKVKLSQEEKKKRSTKEVNGFKFNKQYRHKVFLDKIIEESMPKEESILSKRISKVNGVECVITVNVFLEKDVEGVDIIVASSSSNDLTLKKIIQESEQNIGRELNCVFLTTNELAYRIKANDRFIKSILDDHHTVHLDKKGVLEDIYSN